MLRIIEKYQNHRDLTILTFTLEDYEKLGQGIPFFEIIKSKKMALRLSSNYDSFLKEYSHDALNSVKKRIENFEKIS